MKNIMIIALICILFFSVFNVFLSVGKCKEPSENTIYVDDGGGENYTTIQAAINAANPGDIVYVYSGIYYENVIVNKTLTLIGEDKNTTIIDANQSGDVLTITGDWVNISRFTIQNGGSYGSDMGIYIISDYNTISENIITDNKWNGIYLKNSSSNTILKNNISNNNHLGVYLYESSNNKITGNTIINNSNHGISLIRSSNNTLTENMITNNDAFGIELWHLCNNNTLSSNNISYNYWGIHLLKSYNNSIFENNLANSSYYDVFLQNSSNNSVYHNSFINTSLKAYDNSNNTWYNLNLKEGNYWEDYNGNDTNNDGIGDKPYNIRGGDNQDKYPLMKPYGTELPKKPEGIDTSFIYPMLIIAMIVAIIFCLPIAYYWRKKWFT